MRILIIASIAASIAVSATAQDARRSMPRFVDGKQIVDTPTPAPQAQPVTVPMQPTPAVSQNRAASPDAPARLDQPRSEQATPRPESAEQSERRTPRPEVKKEEPRREEKKVVEKSDSSTKTEKSDKADKVDKDASTVSAVDAATSAVGDFLRASNDGLYSGAAEYLTPHLRAYFEHEISAATGGLKAVADQITKDGRIRRVVYSNWRGRGEGGRLDVQLTYDLGTEDTPRMVSENRTFELQKVNKKWCVIIPVVPGSSVDGMVNGEATEVAPEATPAPTPAATPAPPPVADVTPAAPGGGGTAAAVAAAAPTTASTPADARTTKSALDGLPW